MDIRNWPLDRIMQLPDHCFGQRWVVSVSQQQDAVNAYYDISEAGLPEVCVCWNIVLNLAAIAMVEVDFSLVLGDVLPTTDAEFDANEVFCRELGLLAVPRRQIRVSNMAAPVLIPMRKAVHACGRRLIGRFEWTNAVPAQAFIIVEISSIPTEVPDCLISV